MSSTRYEYLSTVEIISGCMRLAKSIYIVLTSERATEKAHLTIPQTGRTP
jgi:hypothetical protein